MTMTMTMTMTMGLHLSFNQEDGTFANHIGGYAIEASQVAKGAWLVSIYGTRTALQVELYDVVFCLPPSCESYVRVSCSPYG